MILVRCRARLGVMIGMLLAALASPETVTAQSFTQLNCRIVLDRKGNDVTAFAVMQALRPTTADYTLTALKIDANGSGATDQSGTHRLEVGRVVSTARSRFTLAPGGWLEFKLVIVERLTGGKCEASEVVSPM